MILLSTATYTEPITQSAGCDQVKRTCYAQSSQIRQIRKKMVEIMTREASSCDLKELVGKFIPESIGMLFPSWCPSDKAHHIWISTDKHIC